MPNRKKPLVIVTRKLPDSVETRMRELFDAQLNLDDKPMTPGRARRGREDRRRAGADRHRPHRRLGARASPASKLKLIANFGNGVDNIDVATAVQRGITVTNTPGVLTEDTADMTMALILAVPRRLVEGSQVLTGENEWTGWSPTWMLGHRIWGKRLGIIGMGRIGQAVARRAARLRPADPLSQPPPRRAADRGRARAPPIGKASTRCWRAWTSSRSIARTRRRPIICCRRAGSSCCGRRPISSTPRAAR